MNTDEVLEEYGYLYLKCTHPDDEPDCESQCYKCDWVEIDWEVMNDVRRRQYDCR